MTKKCIVCDSEFLPYRKRQKCCSRKCYLVHERDARCARMRSYYRKYPEKWTTHSNHWRAKRAAERPWYNLLGTAKYRAKKESLPFDLTHEWASARWTGYCEMSGIQFVLNKSRSSFSPTIDKVDSSLGYVQSNCRFVLFGVNCMKYTGSDSDVLKMAQGIANRAAASYYALSFGA